MISHLCSFTTQVTHQVQQLASTTTKMVHTAIKSVKSIIHQSHQFAMTVLNKNLKKNG